MQDPQSESPVIEIGSQLGPYKITGKLGEGGMGVVYRAVDAHLARQVAIKTLLGSPDADSTARFLREAKAASRLQHQTIVTIYHIGVETGISYIAMELVEGNTLKRVIDGRPMNIRHACDVAIQVCEGLAAAHEQGVIHRDIKAENIIISPRGAVKILDFGLAKLTEAQSNDSMTIAATQEGIVMGTVSHMSPEQALGREVDTRTDIFSFGVVLYEMFTGRTPFAAQTAQAILARVLNHAPEPLRQSNPSVTAELEQVVADCLQKDREMRPSAVEVLSMLRSVRDALSGRPAGGATQGGRGSTVAPGRAEPAFTGEVPVARASQRPAMPTATVTGEAGAAPATSSGPRPAVTVSSGAHAAAEVTPSMTATYWALRGLRLSAGIATATVPLAFLLHFFIGGGVIRPEIVEGTFIRGFMDAVVGPVLALAGRVLTFRTIVDGWNLLLPLMAVVTLVLRRLVLLPLLRAEQWAKVRIARATRVEARGPSLAAAPQVTDQRMAMLREYAETKKLLFQQKRRLAFLSADVVNVMRLKAGEDKLVLEHAFAEYRKFVERVLAGNNVWKATWQADALLCAFFTPDAAVRAAQQLLTELPWFNDGIHQLRHKFEVHCGVSAGEVVFPEDKRLEDITDEVVDLAVALRNCAPSGGLWVPAECVAEIGDAAGFTAGHEMVSGQAVRTWRPGAAGAAPAVSPLPPDAEGTALAFPPRPH